MNQSDTIETLKQKVVDLTHELEPIQKEVGAAFLALVEGDEDCEELLINVRWLREVHAKRESLQAKRRELDANIKALKSGMGIGDLILAENNARQSEIKAKRIAADKALYEAKIAKKEAKTALLKTATENYEAARVLESENSSLKVSAWETRTQHEVNRQRRSNGGVIRIESGER